MDVDFNNLRRQACIAYDKLCDKLNGKIKDGEIRISAEYIQKDMDDLRSLISTIANVFDKDNPEFQVAYPTDRRMSWFNEETLKH